jgi:hypothetical protein
MNEFDGVSATGMFKGSKHLNVAHLWMFRKERAAAKKGKRITPINFFTDNSESEPEKSQKSKPLPPFLTTKEMGLIAVLGLSLVWLYYCF